MVRNENILKVRGSAKINRETGDVEFTAAQPGDPVQRNVRKCGKSTFYETDGAQQCSYVCHLKVDKDSADPAAEMQQQLERLTACIRKREPRQPRGRLLLESPAVNVWHNRKCGVVSVVMNIDLQTEGEISAKLFNLTAEVNKCFAINSRSLLPRRK